MRFTQKRKCLIILFCVACFGGIMWYFTELTHFILRPLTSIHYKQTTDGVIFSTVETTLDGHVTLDELCKKFNVKQYTLSKLKVKPSPQFRRFNRTNVCFCKVPKASSTSLMRSLLMAENPDKAEHYAAMPGSRIHNGTYTKDAHACMTVSDMSFFVTRDPYQRLFSAYIDKIFLGKFAEMAAKISALNQSSVNKKFLRLGNTRKSNRRCDVTTSTFEQYLHFIVLQSHLDPHFAPITSLCDLCEFQFKLIMKQENMIEQKQELLGYLNKERNVIQNDTVVSLSDYSGLDGKQKTAATFYSLTTDCRSQVEAHKNQHMRFWEALKMLGNVDEKIEYNNSWFNISFENNTYNGTYSANYLVKNLQSAGIRALDDVQRERQRQIYLKRAYNNVHPFIIKSVQELYKMDFMLFGYDINPPSIT